MLLSHARRPKYTRTAWHASKMLTAHICLVRAQRKIMCHWCFAWPLSSCVSFFCSCFCLFHNRHLLRTWSFLRIKPVGLMQCDAACLHVNPCEVLQWVCLARCSSGLWVSHQLAVLSVQPNHIKSWFAASLPALYSEVEALRCLDVVLHARGAD